MQTLSGLLRTVHTLQIANQTTASSSPQVRVRMLYGVSHASLSSIEAV